MNDKKETDDSDENKADPIVSLKEHLMGAAKDLSDIYENTIGKNIEEKIKSADQAVTSSLADACDSMIEIAVDIKKKLKARKDRQ